MSRGTGPTWAGRLPGALDPEAWTFLHSLPQDRFLWPYDIRGTVAHVRTLHAAGLLTDEEETRLAAALEELLTMPEAIEDSDEDVHSAIERLLTERLGDLGAKVHAGRSRNDQVATALRLWTRDTVRGVLSAVVDLGRVLLARVADGAAVLAPGYTHLQRAQPVTLGHWLCAHATAFERDCVRLGAACASADRSPLGAGALAGNTLGTDPEVGARALGFAATFRNSLDAVSDRDFLCDAAYGCAMALMHLSRLAEEVVLWSSSEFGFLVLPDRVSTGSSMMPQKKNPDVAELARAQVGPALGALTALVVTLKGLPLAYDRDLQADKQILPGVFEATEAAFRAMARLLAEMRFVTERLEAAASDDTLLATDLAEALVRLGVPFRRAHELVGMLAQRAAQTGATLREAVEADPQALEPLAADDAFALLDSRAAVERRTTAGGPSRASVERQSRELTLLFDEHLSAAGQPQPSGQT